MLFLLYFVINVNCVIAGCKRGVLNMISEWATILFPMILFSESQRLLFKLKEHGTKMVSILIIAILYSSSFVSNINEYNVSLFIFLLFYSFILMSNQLGQYYDGFYSIFLQKLPYNQLIWINVNGYLAMQFC